MRTLLTKVFSLTAMVALVAVSCAPAVGPTPEVVRETVVVEQTVVVEATPVPEEKPVWWVPEGEEVTLKYWFCMTEKERLERVELARFEQEHPRIKVEVSLDACADYATTLKAAFAAGTAPDVFISVTDHVYEFGDEGFLVPLDPFIARDFPELADFFPVVHEGMTGVDGNRYALGRDWVITGLFYNKDLFDEAGLAYPDDTWTWQDFREAAKKLTKDVDNDGRIDQYGAFVAPDYYTGDSIIWSFGGRVYDPEDNKTHFSDPKSIEALQFLADMILEDKSAPGGQLVTTWGFLREDPFATGQVAMRIHGCWMLGRYKDLTEFDWGIARSPEGPAGSFNTSGMDSFFISKNAEDRGVEEQAWELVRWLSSPEGGILWYTESNPGHMPAHIGIAQSPEYKVAIAPYIEHIEVIQASQAGGVNPFVKYFREWRTKTNAVLVDAFNGLISMEEAARIADEEANAILAQWER